MDNTLPEEPKRDRRLVYENQLPDPEMEDGSRCPNSPLEQIYFDMNHPMRAPWLETASIEKEMLPDSDKPDCFTEKQWAYVQLRRLGLVINR